MLDKYDHKISEKKWQKYWDENNIYSWEPSDNAKREDNFVIDTPPPTVSGLLHMGHIYSYTQADFVARFNRMIGKDVFYPMGFDDNGLPTERLVEKTKKVRATDLSREDFINLCQDVAKDARKEFRNLFESIALSVDWQQNYFTISDDSRALSQMSFIDLFNKDQIYQKLQPMLWDPVDQTAIAQAEVEDKEHDSFMNHINFKCLETDENLTIATTRPELLGACVAVFYHPEDERYKHLEGKNAITALFGVKVPLLKDDQVKMDKGTGLVMCCTFGDETDIHWWQTHKLATRILLDKYGKIRPILNEDNIEFIDGDENSRIDKNNCNNIEEAKQAFEIIAGKKAHIARSEIIEVLKDKNLLIKQDKITHAVKCAERSGAALEILPTKQWFVKVLEHKEALKKKADECNWNPDFMRHRVHGWIDGLSWDWCISRQRYFGVPFPVWYSKKLGEEGKIILADPNDLPINPLVDLPKGYEKHEVEPELDVMDTWATSSISPQLNSRAINNELTLNKDDNNKRHELLYPASLRPQAHEIIRTWAFYTIVKSYLHNQTIPWENLMISGWCLAKDKTKMSKSKGNVVTPVDLIEEKGSDVVRYWASTSRLGADTAYSDDVLKIGKKLVNKIFNAAKFTATHLEKSNLDIIKNKQEITANDLINKGLINEPLDIWILSKLKIAIEKATSNFIKFEYCIAREAIEDFFWNDFCDNYLELVKARSYAEDESITKEQQDSAHLTLYIILENILKLFAPFVPHVTEEIYQGLFNKKTSIHEKNSWPIAEDFSVNEESLDIGKNIVKILNLVRKIKAEKNLSIKTPILELTIASNDETNLTTNFKKALVDFKFTSNSVKINIKKADELKDAIKSEDDKWLLEAKF